MSPHQPLFLTLITAAAGGITAPDGGIAAAWNARGDCGMADGDAKTFLGALGCILCKHRKTIDADMTFDCGKQLTLTLLSLWRNRRGHQRSPSSTNLHQSGTRSSASKHNQTHR